MLRKIAGVSRLDHVRNEMVRERLREEPVLKKVERMRMLEGEGGEQEGKCGGKGADREGIEKRLRGRPRKRWGDPF